MTLQVAGLALAVAPSAQGKAQEDLAGWLISAKLKAPFNVSLAALPATAPELNPVENVWKFMRDNWFSDRVFTSHDNIVAPSCKAWNKLVNRPWRITTIGRRQWTRRF